jgi:F420H(2)-dependent quinone reductase
VLSLRDGQRIVLPASYGGRDHPTWYLNLRDDACERVQVGADVTDDERRLYWRKLTRIYPPYKGYQDAADRRIPLVVCEPI